MDRRTFIGGVAGGLLAAPLANSAQPAAKLYRIGTLANTRRRPDAVFRESPFARALQDLGWRDGENIVFEHRGSDGNAALLPGLAQELVRAHVDVVVMYSGYDSAAAREAIAGIPVVTIFTGEDPSERSLYASLGRPGGNVTGVSRMLNETEAKRLELIKEVLPPASRVGALVPATGIPERQARFESVLRGAARDLRIELHFYRFGNQDELDAAFPVMADARVQAFLLRPTFETFRNRQRIATLAREHRLPGVFTLREYAQAGGLMSYGPNWSALEQQLAVCVDRILRGAKPGDLPIDQPKKFDLVVNVGTAKALGLMLPQTLLARADELIQ